MKKAQTGAYLSLGPLCLLGLFSGLSALCYEVVWTRLFSLRLGTTTAALTAVLVAFMLGLGLGSLLLGRIAGRIRHALRAYALLEAGIGLCAIAVPFIIRALPPGQSRPFPLQFSTAPLLALLEPVLVLIIPTMLMGGTLPMLLASGARGKALHSAIGPLYAANTLGGILGVIAATFVGFTTIGIARTNLTAASVNLALAAFSLVLSFILVKASPSEAPSDPPAPKAAAAPIPLFTLAAAAACGLAILGMEICWSRAMSFVLFGRNIYIVTIMLATVLGGLAIGGALAGPVTRKWGGPKLLGIVLVWLAAACTVSLWAMLAMPSVILAVGGKSFALLVLGQAIGSAIVILPPTILSGMALPIAAGGETERRGSVSGFGDVYAANTIGAVIGPILTTYFLIPSTGLRAAAVILSIVCWIVGAAAFRPRFRASAAALAVLLVVIVPIRGHYVYGVYAGQEDGAKLLYKREGVGATVTVLRLPNNNGLGTFRVLDIDATNVAGTNPELIAIQKLQAHLPLILHGNVKSVLHIGFGSGGTCYSASLHDLPRLDAVELSPEVLQSADLFPDTNHGVLSNPKLHVYVDDARSYLEGTPNSYDAILSDSIHPQILGNSWLYSEDYFRLCKSRLKPGGVLSFWLPIYSLSRDDLRMILKTLQNVFPECYVWYPGVVRSPFTIATAFNGHVKIDRELIARGLRPPAVKEDLAEIGADTTDEVLSFRLLGPDEVRALCGDIPANTDDMPALELSAPRAFDRNRTWADNFAMLLHARQGPAPPATEHLLRAQMNQLVYKSEDVFANYSLVRGTPLSDWAERQAVDYALEAGDAEDTLRLMIDQFPKDMWYRGLLARRMIVEDRIDEVAPLLAPFGDRLGTRSKILLALAYSATGDDARAKRLLESRNPRTAEVWSALAGIAARQGKQAQAVQDFSQAVAEDPRNNAVRKLLAQQLTAQGDLLGAARQYEILRRRTPADIDMLTAYADVLDKLGKRDEAGQVMQTARRIGG